MVAVKQAESAPGARVFPNFGTYDLITRACLHHKVATRFRPDLVYLTPGTSGISSFTLPIRP
jgi:hypothetical protein